MIAAGAPLSEIDILAHLVGPSQPLADREFAHWVLSVRFDEETECRIRDLLERNNSGELDAGERELLERYLRVGQFIDLLQAKARLTVSQASA